MSTTKEKKLYEEYYDLDQFYKNKFGNNVVILMQVGAFYELYKSHEANFKGANLEDINRITNLVVTKKNNDKPSSSANPYMSGFQIQNAGKYIKSLLENNYTIITIDQDLLDPKNRNVSNIITPSMNVDEELRDSSFIVCIYIEINSNILMKNNSINVGLTSVDVNLLDVYYDELHDDKNIKLKIENFCNNYNTKEIIIYEINNTKNENISIMNKLKFNTTNVIRRNKINNDYFKKPYQNKLLKKIYKSNDIITPIEYLNMSFLDQGLTSLISCLSYIEEHNEKYLLNLKKPKQYKINNNLYLGNNAVIQLEIVDDNSKYETLNSLINKCLTPMGYRFMKKKLMAPFTDKNEIENYYNLSEIFLKSVNFLQVETMLKNTGDIEKLLRKIEINYLQPYSILKFIITLEKYCDIIKYFKSIKVNIDIDDDEQSKLENIILELKEIFNVDVLNICFDYNNSISIYNKNVHKDIDSILSLMNDKDSLMDKFILKILDITEDKNVKIKKCVSKKGEYSFKINVNDGTKIQKKLETIDKQINIDDKLCFTKDDFLYSKNKTNITISFKDNNKITNNDLLLRKLNKQMIMYSQKELLDIYDNNKLLFIKLIDVITLIDYVLNNVIISQKYHYTKPILIDNNNSFIEAKELRHPIIERNINEEYVPNNVTLDNNNLGMLLYGVNQCGKSSLMKAIGINLIMAQCGLYVPSKIFKYGIFHSLYTRITSDDNLHKNQSSFAVEIYEIKNIIENGNENSLILLDEALKTTEQISEISLVASILLQMIDLKLKFIFTTHLHELTLFDDIKNIKELKFYHLKVEIKEDEIIYDRLLQEGSGEDIYGITVAKFILKNNKLIDKATEFKNKYLEIIGYQSNNTKKTKYNKDIYMEKCDLCDSKKHLETHHIYHQRDFNNDIHNDKFHVLKNDKCNLIVLCRKCHDKLHDGKITIEPKKMILK